MRFILIAIILMMGSFLIAVSDYDSGTSMILIQEEAFQYDYLLQGFSVLKIVIILYSAFLWMYGTQINHYDVYLYTRYSHRRVFLSKWIAIQIIVLLLTGFLIVEYVLVWVLYPNALQEMMILELFGVLMIFTGYYNVLFWFFSTVIKHLYGNFIPIIGYILSMITVDINMKVDDQGIIAKCIQIIYPDIVYYDNHFRFMYGGLFVFCMTLIFSSLVIHIFQKNDVF